MNVDQTSEDIHSFNPTVMFHMVKDDHTHQGILTNDPYISTLATVFQFGDDNAIIVKLRSSWRMMAQ